MDFSLTQADSADSADSKPKQLQMIFVLLTYTHIHVNKDEYMKWFHSKFDCKTIQIAHETGLEGNHPHSHVIVEFNKRYRTRDKSLRDFDYSQVHPNVKILPGRKAYVDALGYISKEDKSIVVEPLSFVEQVWQCETIEDALRLYCKKPSDAPGIFALYSARPVKSIWSSIELRQGWQTDFYNLIKDDVNERSVYWLNSSGNSGKTYFLKYMLQTHPYDTVVIADAYDQKDIALIFKNAIETNNTCRYVIFDCSRSYTFPKQFYSIIERVKDGLITSTKYNSKTVHFRNAVLVVMANQWPEISRLTFDRWRLFLIDSDGIMQRQDTKSILDEQPPFKPFDSFSV